MSLLATNLAREGRELSARGIYRLRRPDNEKRAVLRFGHTMRSLIQPCVPIFWAQNRRHALAKSRYYFIARGREERETQAPLTQGRMPGPPQRRERHDLTVGQRHRERLFVLYP